VSTEIAAILVALSLFGLFRWRQAVQLALVLTVFEGAIRKWILPDAQQYVYFFKDTLLFGAYVAFFAGRLRNHQRLVSPHLANLALGLLFVFGVVEIANPALPTALVGLFGLKAYFMYVPLMYMTPAALPDAATLRRFWTGYLIVSLVPLVLGTLQFYAAPDSVLNRYPWGEEGMSSNVVVFGSANQVRITGTFSFITGYTNYLTLLAVFALALLAGERVAWLRWSLRGFLVMVVTNLVMTGSRGPFLVLAAAAPVLVILAARRGRGPALRVALTLGMSLPVIGLLVGVMFSDAGTAFVERATEGRDVAERMLAAVAGPLRAVGRAGLMGYGIGTTHQAISFLVPPSEIPMLEAEGEWERIILELGPIGFGLALIVRILVVRRLWLAVTAPAAEGTRPFLAGAFVLCLMALAGDVVFAHTASVFYWFVAGFALIPATKAETAARHAREGGERRRGLPGGRPLPAA
jgi:hypothetical protein